MFQNNNIIIIIIIIIMIMIIIIAVLGNMKSFVHDLNYLNNLDSCVQCYSWGRTCFTWACWHWRLLLLVYWRVPWFCCIIATAPCALNDTVTTWWSCQRRRYDCWCSRNNVPTIWCWTGARSLKKLDEITGGTSATRSRTCDNHGHCS